MSLDSHPRNTGNSAKEDPSTKRTSEARKRDGDFRDALLKRRLRARAWSPSAAAIPHERHGSMLQKELHNEYGLQL
eukprot:11393843-Alexandrium_andersonii.AAC.1